MQTLLDSERFLPLANLVATKGVRYFVEPTFGPGMHGLEAARRLNLQGFVCEPKHPEGLSAQYPDFHVYDGDPLSFLITVLPMIDGPAFFWLDPASPTYEAEQTLIQEASHKISLYCDWYIDHKPRAAQAPPVETFDRNWHGPEWMKPRVYRTQSEKDTWNAVAVENEYRAPDVFEENDLIVDIGAHIGSFSWLAHMKGSRRVYAFEVDPWHIEAARANLDGLLGVNLYHAAVVRSDAGRKAQYHYDGNWDVFTDKGIEVDSVSLDEIIEELGSIRFLKTDTEGSEWPILYTCTKLDRVQEIAGEYHEGANFNDPHLPPNTIRWLTHFLQQHGFDVDYTANIPGIGNFWARRR